MKTKFIAFFKRKGKLGVFEIKHFYMGGRAGSEDAVLTCSL